MYSIFSISAFAAWALAISPVLGRLSYPKARQSPDNLTPIMFSDPILEPNIVATFPNGTWIENLAVRSTDGNFLGTVLSAPEVYLISTSNEFDPILVAQFPEYLACLGIVELGLDTFYAIVGNFSVSTFTSTPGSYSIWEIDLTNFDPSPSCPGDDDQGHWSDDWKRASPDSNLAPTKKIADLPSTALANGLTVLNPTLGILLVADSLNGAVYAADIRTGAVTLAINDTASMAPDASLSGGLALGINGLLAANGYLYYDNSNKVTFNRVPINQTTGAALGPVETLIDQEFANIFPDDFTLDSTGNAWLACEYGHIAFFEGVAAGEKHNITAVAGNSTGLPHGLTAARFGVTREDLERGSLYVSTNGGPFEYAKDLLRKGSW